MGKITESDIHKPIPSVDDEDEQTLAAIDEGIRDADAARSVPAEEVRKLPWIAESSTRKDR
jgi:predicted transcriptional regulator